MTPSKLHSLTANTYDATITVLTISDTVLDIIVAIIWYNLNRMTFFWINIAILILIHILYVIMFYIGNRNKEPLYNSSIVRQLSTITCLIPFAPFLYIICFLRLMIMTVYVNLLMNI